MDSPVGKAVFQAVTLAVEETNAEGGVLGRNLTIVAEDDDSETPPLDISVASNALTKLITVDKADYIMTSNAVSPLVFQDLAAEHKKILFSVWAANDELTQRVDDNYDKYKYFFKVYAPNSTSVRRHVVSSLITLKNYTGFTKIGFLVQDMPQFRESVSNWSSTLLQYGFEVVYSSAVLFSATDFTSQFAQIEASGAEILVPVMVTQQGTFFVEEWCERQSPFVMWGILPTVQNSNAWNWTKGKCEFVSSNGMPVVAGYPWTNKSLPAREAFIKKWGEPPSDIAMAAYDTVRFILYDAIKRAETTETQAVIKTLETTDVETSMAQHFIFTSSHDMMMTFADPNDPTAIDEGHVMYMTFQWQDGKQVPVYPEEIMQELGATFRYPPWKGPWSEEQTP